MLLSGERMAEAEGQRAEGEGAATGSVGPG